MNRQKITNFFRDHAKEKLQDEVVYSSWDLSELCNESKYENIFEPWDDESEQIVDEIMETLVKEKLVYRQGDWESYKEMVQKKGFISHFEKSYIIPKIKDNRIKLRDLEFPINKTGRYTAPVDIGSSISEPGAKIDGIQYYNMK